MVGNNDTKSMAAEEASPSAPPLPYAGYTTEWKKVPTQHVFSTEPTQKNRRP